MTTTATPYVELRGPGESYWVAGTRVSLDSVVHSFRRGSSPETIAEEYPALNPAQIYGAIAFYLEHQSDVDAYLVRREREAQANRQPLKETDPDLWERLQRARK